MNEQQLEQQIYDSFPIARTMGMKVKSLSPTHSELFFPLGPNHNNIGTAFGGALYSAAVFACYALYRKVLAEHGIEEGRFLNRKAEIEYEAPTTKDFVARAEIDATSDEFGQFIQSMRRHGLSHLPMEAAILVEDKPVARFKASFLMAPPDNLLPKRNG
jgi:thioesterase domain-containing protein